MIGISVIRGERATLSPAFRPYLSVSETVSRMRGPGERPAVSPSKKAARKISAVDIRDHLNILKHL